jgi:hypothetical protein
VVVVAEVVDQSVDPLVVAVDRSVDPLAVVDRSADRHHPSAQLRPSEQLHPSALPQGRNSAHQECART